MKVEPTLDSEDFLSDSLQTLYDYQPVALTAFGTAFTFTLNSCPLHHEHSNQCTQPIDIPLDTPDTDAANWALHASSIWMSSVYLASHIGDLDLDAHIVFTSSNRPLRVLELGASAGLPSILIAKLYAHSDCIRVVATDYPDEKLMKTLSNNVHRNGVARRCKALPYAWGTDPAALFLDDPHCIRGFDIVIAADTLWNPELHDIFIDALVSTLKKTAEAVIYLVVGLHTGRYTIQSFLTKVKQSGLEINHLSERMSAREMARDWDISRAEGEDEKERRKWIVWIQLKWTRQVLELHT